MQVLYSFACLQAVVKHIIESKCFEKANIEPVKMKLYSNPEALNVQQLLD
jgi:hypothetical protein